MGVNILIIATDVKGVALDFGGPGERFLDSLTVRQAEKYLADGQFPPGSVGPKVEAAVQFIKNGGERAVICSVNEIEKAAGGLAGTEIVLG